MRLADVSSRVQEVSERYQVPEKVSVARQKLYEGMNVASDAAVRGAHAAYRVARENPRTEGCSGTCSATRKGPWSAGARARGSRRSRNGAAATLRRGKLIFPLLL
jgi:hypothetical protein